MAERIALVDMAAGFADHENQLAFIVELLRRTRPHNRAIVPDERTGKANEQRRITRRRCAIAIFPGPVGIVDADAEDPRIGADRRPEREHARRPIWPVRAPRLLGRVPCPARDPYRKSTRL